MNDYYEILEIGRNASAIEIRAAYKRQAMLYHPDRNSGDKEAEEKFKLINEAYHILSDPLKKFRYDTIIEDGRLMTKVRFFDVWDTKFLRYLNYVDRVNMILEAGLDPVPELYRGVWLGKEAMYPLAEGLTTLGGKHIREGWVLNTLVERFEPKLNSRMQVKLVGEGYNLQK